MTTLQMIRFEEFPLTWGIIDIPDNTVFYRTGDYLPTKENIPRWFSDFETASVYKQLKPSRTLFMCTTKKMKLIDLRVLRYIFMEDVLFKNKKFSPAESHFIKQVLFALGCLNFNEQLEMINEMDDNLKCFFIGDTKVKLKHAHWMLKSMGKGQRISIGEIDALMVQFFKHMYPDVDGYIAPKIDTPWHNIFHQEICLFDPQSVLKRSYNVLDEHLQTFKYNETELLANINKILESKTKFETPIFVSSLILKENISKNYMPFGSDSNPDYMNPKDMKGGNKGKKCKIVDDYMDLRDKAVDELNYKEICKKNAEACKPNKDVDKVNKTLLTLLKKMKS
jgi:hypothetical protein